MTMPQYGVPGGICPLAHLIFIVRIKLFPVAFWPEIYYTSFSRACGEKAGGCAKILNSSLYASIKNGSHWVRLVWLVRKI